MLASRTSRWSAGTALVCVVLVAAAWFLLIAPRRADAAATRLQQSDAQQANDLLRVQVAQLRAQAANLGKTRAELAELHQEMPPTADVPGVVRTIANLSAAAGTELDSISPGAAAALKPPGSTSGSTGVIAVPLTLVATGDYYQVVGFVRALQSQMPRAMLLTDVKVDKTGSDAIGVKLTLTGDVFTMPVTGSAASGGSAGSGGAAAAGSGGSAAVAPGVRAQ